MTDGTIETIGCDLGDKYGEMFILQPDGSGERPRPVKLTQAAMKGFFSRPRAHVVIEVGTHSRWVNELLRESPDPLVHRGCASAEAPRATAGAN